MKKRIFFVAFLMLLLVGCGSFNKDDIVKNFEKSVNSSEGYYLNGELEIINNEETYIYDVEVSYKAEDLFRVSLMNKTNNHEQIILKNAEGVYVLTPSLNKSFKFQSDWPYNNSQSYLLQVIVNDLNNDNEKSVEEVDGGYVVTAKANYSNNKDLNIQKIYFDSAKNITKVEVLNNDGVVKIRMTFKNIDLNSTFDDKHFKLETAMESAAKDEKEQKVSVIDEVIFPMYLPSGTYLASQSRVDLDYGQRVILSFGGEKPFTIVQETVQDNNDVIIPVFGEPLMLSDSIGIISENMANWFSNGIEYYISSSSLDQDEIIEVANSISVMPVGK